MIDDFKYWIKLYLFIYKLNYFYILVDYFFYIEDQKKFKKNLCY